MFFPLFFFIIDFPDNFDSCSFAQIFYLAAEIVIPTGTPSYEERAEIETQSLAAEKKTRTCSK